MRWGNDVEGYVWLTAAKYEAGEEGEISENSYSVIWQVVIALSELYFMILIFSIFYFSFFVVGFGLCSVQLCVCSLKLNYLTYYKPIYRISGV